jgi:hypothetical protein
VDFVVLPELKIVGAMLDSTWLTRKTREEQQQVPPKLLFYQSTKTNNKTLFHPYTSFIHSNKQNTKPIR